MMIRPEIQSEIDATRDAMAKLRQAVLSTPAYEATVGASAGPQCVDGNTTGARLRAIRHAQGLSQRAFAAALNVSAGRIGSMETDKCALSRSFLEKVSDAYGVSADWLLFGRGHM